MWCGKCGSSVRPLLTVDGSEWDGGSVSWRPIEDLNLEVPPYPVPTARQCGTVENTGTAAMVEQFDVTIRQYGRNLRARTSHSR
jgi:hypothetical protein